MARIVRTEVDFVDDLDGKPVDPDEAATVEFSVRWPGSRKTREYSIDLRPSNLTKFETALNKYIENATEVRNGNTVTRTSVSSGSGASKEQLQAIRAWARENGYEISDRGRISAEIQEAYDQAH